MREANICYACWYPGGSMRPSDERVIGEFKGDAIPMGKYGEWVLIEQRDTFGWWAKRVKKTER